VANGNGYAPPPYSEAVSVAEEVQGQEQGVSEAAFSSPIASETGTMFVIVEYPSNYEAPAGGAALGVGYAREPGDPAKRPVYPYFVTGDGETWISVSSRCRVLLDPILADRTDEAVVFRGPDKAKRAIPIQEFGLYAAPNPFNPQTTVALYLKAASTGDLRIYDIRGRLVTVLYTGPLVQGANSFTWDGRDSAGRGVASGAYWVQTRTSDESLTVKVLLLR
jgi:FlgD Ig-like domain